MSTITLPNVRTSSDVTLRVHLLDNEVALDWANLSSIKAWIFSDDQEARAGRCVVSVDQEDSTVLLCEYAATKPQYLGVNRVIIQGQYEGRTKTYDMPAFVFVAWTEQLAGQTVVLEDPVVDVEIEVTDVSSSILDGAIQAALNAADDAEDAAASAAAEEAAIETAEAARVLAENARVNAEAARALQASQDHTRAGEDHTRADADHETATGDHTTAADDHTTAEEDHTRAGQDHTTAAADHTTAADDHTTAADDHTRAGQDHTTAAADHTTAASDHTTAASDHTTASNDHTTAGEDHTRAGQDHTQALADHQVVEGYNTRLTGVEGEVSQLEAKVDITPILLVRNASITTGDTIGTTLSLVPYSATSWDCALVPCSEGDKLIINGTGGNNARLWCFVDSENTVLSVSAGSAPGTNLELTAPANSAYCIINTRHSSAGACYYIAQGCIIPRLDYIENRVANLDKVAIRLIQGYSIDTIGTTLSLVPYPVAGWDCALVPCSEGDKLIINGTGGSNRARLWCFVDSENTVLSVSAGSASGTNLELTAPANSSYCIINVNHSSAGECYYIAQGCIVPRLDNVEKAVAKLEEWVFDAIQLELVQNASIATGSTVGATIQLTPYSWDGWDYALVPCSEGDKLIINGTGGNNARLWCFVDSENTVLSVSAGSATGTNLELTAPANSAYCIINVNHSSAGACYYTNYHVSLPERISNLESLVFNIPSVDFRLPGDVPKIYITSPLLTPNSTNNTIAPLTYSYDSPGEPVGSTDTDDVLLEFKSSTLNFTDRIEINYQGSSSLADPQKNFSIDLAKKHKFGNWMEFDSFHLKGFYEEFFKCRDWVCNRMMEQIYRTRDVGKTRPFLFYNDFGTDYRGFFGSNALCHVDGFPCELYINDVYWGLYVWRLKKHRDNYQFNKNDTNHVFLDAQDWKYNDGAFTWTGVEIRNPKSDSGNTSFPEKVEPNPGEVKTIIEAWETFLWGITSETAKADIEAHFNMDDFIDCYLLTYVNNIWDSWARNTLYGTWDGQHFSPMVYDMNYSFNGFAGKNSGSWTPYYPPTSETFNQKARILPWFHVLEGLYKEEIRSRYKELREIGIFSEKNILGLFQQFTIWVGFNAYKRQAERWPDCPGYIGENRDMDTMDNLRAWVTARLQYMDSVMM